MGEADVRITDSDIKQPESETGTGSKKTGSTRNRSTKTTDSGTGSGTVGTGSGKSETAGNKRIQTEKNSKVSVLGDLPEVNIPEPQQPKQKRKYTKKVKEEKTDTLNSEQLATLLVAVSSIVASREGCSHWLISKSEAEQIAKPLSNIIEKSEKIKALGEHADAFALVTACLMIFTPRLIATFQINKAKKGVKKTNGFKHISKPNRNDTDGRITTGSGQHNNAGKDSNSNRTETSGTSNSFTNVSKSLFEAVDGE